MIDVGPISVYGVAACDCCRRMFVRRLRMRRSVVAIGLLTFGALSLVVAAYQQPAAGGGQQPAPKVVEVDKVKDNLFVLRGGGGNTAVFVGSNGVVVVDTKQS